MVEYTKTRIMAQKLIEGMIIDQKSLTFGIIALNVTKRFGLGEQFVKKYLRLLVEFGTISYDEPRGIISLIPRQKTQKEMEDEAYVEVFLKEQQLTSAARDEK